MEPTTVDTPPEDAIPRDQDALYVPRDEYLRLLKISDQYANLRAYLIQGGVTDEAVKLLSDSGPRKSSRINEAQPPAESASKQEKQEWPSSKRPKEPACFQQSISHPSASNSSHADKEDESQSLAPSDSSSSSSDSPLPQRRLKQGAGGRAETYQDQPIYELVEVATRTILFSNLSDEITHADITGIVRGGQLLDICLRRRDRTATVSFVYENDARAFYEHVRRHDIYIKQKRVVVSWSDWQFVLPGHMIHRIRGGASRNLVIRRCNAQHTESDIRHHLEHIHNLVVVGIDFTRNACFIRTNSVAGATFAKTCMMSRQAYRGCRVEFGEDECAQPLEELIQPVRRPYVPVTKTPKTLPYMANRYEVLGVDP